MGISRYIFVITYIRKHNKKDFDSYRDDGLGVVKKKSGLGTEKIKKNIQKIFK